MKIKQKHIHTPSKQSNYTKLSSKKLPSHTAPIPTQQSLSHHTPRQYNMESKEKISNFQHIQEVYLPSEYMLYRQLINELGLQSKDDRIKFRNNFKEKYQKHLEMLHDRSEQIQRFKASKEKQLELKQKKLEQMKEYIQNKQVDAKERKNVLVQIRSKRNQQQEQKWKNIVEKNKSQYLKNIKNSMKLVKRWQSKLQNSANRKIQLLNKISQQMQQHNQYVNAVMQKTKLDEQMQAQQKIQKLQRGISMDIRSKKRIKTKQSDYNSKNNPQCLRTPQNTSKLSRRNNNQKIQRYKTLITQSSLKQQSPTQALKIRINKSPRSIMSSKLQNNNSLNISRSSSTQHLQIKKQMDQELIEQSLCKNVEKQKKIAEARHLKSYLHQQRYNLNKEKYMQLLQKRQQNLQKLCQQQNRRHQQLEQKFNRKIEKVSYKNIQSSYRSHDLSLPSIVNKSNLSINSNNPQDDSPSKSKLSQNNGISYRSKNKSQNLQLKQVSDGHGHNYLYLTQIKQYQNDKKNNNSKPNIYPPKSKNKYIKLNTYKKPNISYDEQGNIKYNNAQKYNRVIMQKLRNMSLISNIKYKQYESMESLTDDIRNMQGGSSRNQIRQRQKKKEKQLMEILRNKNKSKPNMSKFYSNK